MRPSRPGPWIRSGPTLALAILLAACGRGEGADSDSGPAPLVEAARIALPGVEGRIDHLSLDAKGHRLFVAALGNDTVEVVDLAERKRAKKLEGLSEPEGVVWLPEISKLVVSNGGGGSAFVYSGDELGRERTVSMRSDPDNSRAEPGGKRVWIGEGSGRRGALAALDPVAGKVTAEIPLDGHPEAFELETKGKRIFVNVPARHEVEVVDRDRGKVVSRYPLPEGANFPMALDEKGGRLYVASRRPDRLYVLATDTGKVSATLDAPEDADDIFVDAALHRLYVVAGEGVVRVYRLPGEGPPVLLADVPTAPGARTGLFDPEGKRLFVAVPHRGSQAAGIRILRTN